MKHKRPAQLHLRKMAMALYGILALALFSGVAVKQAGAISLKPTSVLTENTIKLGDVFDGLDHKSDRVLGAAPRPGQSMTLNARTLLRIAVALDLNWRPSSSAEAITLTRAATVIDRSDIERALTEALLDEGVQGRFNLVIPNEMAEMVLPHGSAKTIEVSSIQYRADNQSFDAILAGPSQDNPQQQMRVVGTFERLVEVPVLYSTIQSGDIIRARDIHYIDMPESRIQHDMVLKSEDLIGMTPRRMVLSGKPLKDQDLQAPRIVGRGEMITMVFANSGLQLTAEGKALEFGAKGDIIRVVNTASNRTIQGLVTAEREVTVTSF